MQAPAGRLLDRSSGEVSFKQMVATAQREVFKKQKVKLGKKNCMCDFDLKMNTKCSGKATCDKKCSGQGTVEIKGCSFTLKMKKGKGSISNCACAAPPTEAPTPTGTGSGSGPMPGSGSGPMPGSGSGSGETPVPMTGPGSGGEGEGMQCQCKCNCPDGSGECDCDCNCPMTSKAVTCAEGFSKVCPMMEGKCPADMDMMCPNGAMTRMAGGNGGEGSDKGCQCVPDFLMAMVMPAPAGRSLDRSSGKVSFKIGKKTCKCDYKINAGNCKNSKITCDKKCSGSIKGVELEDGMYVMDLGIKKGKVTIAKCKKEAGSEPTEPGTGGGGNGGAGSGSGNGGEGSGASRCACVSKGMGGTGPSPPTGSGSGPAPTGSESGSGSGPPPTGSGSGSEPAPPTGSGSGSGLTKYD